MEGIYMAGKLANVAKKMKKIRFNVLDLSDVRWLNSKKIQHSNPSIMHYSGYNFSAYPNWVAIIFPQEIDKAVLAVIPNSYKMILLKIYPVDINIIHVYAPTAEKPDREINNFYSELK